MSLEPVGLTSTLLLFPIHPVNPVCFALHVSSHFYFPCSPCRSFLFWLERPVLAFEFEPARAEIEQQANVNAGGGQVIDDLDLVSDGQ